ncbi:hypothetical protein PR048_028022 [Dryococelus australis]|uniref:Uncharacterized protein n=1 Tax=Dryococelus australis TaxID=614101 RepID=A0ABQ9GI34_9NEOP|nr:hypothetical protein PR048_028022 [Dryococelus australis]
MQMDHAYRDIKHIIGDLATRAAGNMDVEELRQALLQAQVHNEELVSEMKALEKELSAEKQEVEKVGL